MKTVTVEMTSQGTFAFDPDVRFERDGAWFVARPVVVSGAYFAVAASCSKDSFADAERLLRRMLAASAK